MSERDCMSEKLDDINKTLDVLVDKTNSIEARLDSEIDAKYDSPVTAKLDDMNKKFENLIDRIQAIQASWCTLLYLLHNVIFLCVNCDDRRWIMVLPSVIFQQMGRPSSCIPTLLYSNTVFQH